MRGRPKRTIDRRCVCLQCGTTFLIAVWEKSAGKFCTHGCYLAWRKEHPEFHARPKVEPTVKVCEFCGTGFETGGGGRPRRTQRFCSIKCQAKGKAKNHGHLTARTLSEPEVAWMAGLLDGEGCIVWPRGKPFQIRIAISNTVRPLLERIIEVTGTGIIIFRKSKNPRHHDSMWWQTQSDNALNLVRQMLPWLIVKREKAVAALEGRVVPPQPRGRVVP